MPDPGRERYSGLVLPWTAYFKIFSFCSPHKWLLYFYHWHLLCTLEIKQKAVLPSYQPSKDQRDGYEEQRPCLGPLQPSLSSVGELGEGPCPLHRAMRREAVL